MILWLLYFILSLIFSVLCYITNPIVLLFCNDDGELPGFLSLWQTWDNSCNPSDIKDIAPDWLLFDWDAHYREYQDSTQYLRSVNRERWYTYCYNKDFTVLEWLKRYACRVLWLTRNNAYGFCFYLLGANVSPVLDKQYSENTIFVREIFGGNVGGAWMYKNTAKIFSAFGWEVHWNNLLGWKIDTSATQTTRAMVANRIALYFEKEAD